MTTREKVESLRSVGKNYDEISAELGITKSCVYWHASERNREYARKKRSENRASFIVELKKERGGKCSICGYDKCLAALHFHHTEPENKSDLVGKISRSMSQKLSREEAKKCVLVCANCHAEEHWPNK